MHKFERRIARLEEALCEEQLSPDARGRGMLGLLRLAEARQEAEIVSWLDTVDPEELTGFCRLLWEHRHGQ
jgi:hypothetical protein